MASLALGGSGMASMGPHGVPLGPFWPILGCVKLCEAFFAAVTHFVKRLCSTNRSNRSAVIALYTLYCNTKCVTDTLVTLLRQERNIL